MVVSSGVNDASAPAIAVGGRRCSSLGPVPGSYLRAIASAGGRPVVLAPSRQGARSAGELLASCAALLLTGGGDVAPELYGGRPGAGRDAVDPLRDACELALLADATQRGLPVLAICHGMQLLNVARGGSLLQQLRPPVAGRHGTREAWTRHAVRVRRGSRLATAVGAGELGACSSHHQQAVALLGAGLVESGWSDDGLVEAIEDAGARWIVGVQWHPEDTAACDAEQQRIFGAFVDAARTGGGPR
jgi:putative glutamine amidotransferase